MMLLYMVWLSPTTTPKVNAAARLLNCGKIEAQLRSGELESELG